YERAAGDKTLPSDLRPPRVLEGTLDYLFGDLMVREGFKRVYGFLRDRTRAVRSDFVMMHERGREAVRCHERCARFHLVALHEMRGEGEFSVSLEEQQLMNTLQSLKEFYTDVPNAYPNQLEMRIYHRLIHIRDQRERQDDVPPSILSHPLYKLTSAFRAHVQKTSEPITKTSKLVVDPTAMEIFGQLAGVLMREGGGGKRGMVYLVACILEHLFGKDTIEDMESLRDGLELRDVIDGV
ncbi:SAC3/GANP/Nin1/mts3/eIF-3 p25 family-domain-containing protein, partial [Lentinula raphanica]